MNQSISESNKKCFSLFCKKVQELENSRYLFDAKQSGIEFNFKWQKDKGITQKRTGPDEESIKAFILTLRFFIQNNERISIYNISKLINDLNINTEFKNDFNRARNDLNNDLDRSSNICIVINGKLLTQRDIFDTFLYGLYAHGNNTKAILLESWEKSGQILLLRSMFDNIVLGILGTLSYMRIIIQKNIINNA